MNRSTTRLRRTGFIVLVLCSSVSLTSCYSVRFVDKQGVGKPNPLNQSKDAFTRGLDVITLDTTIKLKPHLGSPMLLESCNGNGFYYFEYRVTFGGVLLSAITFGRKRQVRIKYVCMKAQ
ncbi:hypothetical protein [Paraflavitalea pollutisoli]|uniref:hypothetical protein n=1 Tax=Paraflavitalea pollutisoli TaxID=3034143 RepID=UPI0023EE1DBC|nr:hypothetical protein [Paraflavitalea sp. H1-2-19X]